MFPATSCFLLSEQGYRVIMLSEQGYQLVLLSEQGYHQFFWGKIDLTARGSQETLAFVKKIPDIFLFFFAIKQGQFLLHSTQLIT